MTVTVSDRVAFAEIDELLKILDEKLVNKIPESVKRVHRNNRDKNYKVVFFMYKPIQEQNLSKKAVTYLAEIYLKYWATKEERKKTIDILKVNDEKISREHEEEYDLEKFLKKKNENKIEEEKVECVSLVKVEKESFIQKIINKIKLLFKR